jgi:hypothetical protein
MQCLVELEKFVKTRRTTQWTIKCYHSYMYYLQFYEPLHKCTHLNQHRPLGRCEVLHVCVIPIVTTLPVLTNQPAIAVQDLFPDKRGLQRRIK